MPAPIVARAAVHSNPRGMMLMIAAGLCFAISHSTIKHVSAGLHPFEIVFFRTILSVCVLVPMFLRGGFPDLRHARWGLHGLRGVAQFGGTLCLFTALGLIPLAQVTALTFASPVFAAVGASLIFREAQRPGRWLAIAAGFVGMLVVLRPGLDEISLGSVLVLGGAALFATTKMMAKSLARTETSPQIVTCVTIVVLPLALVAALFVWSWPTAEQLAWLVWIGIVATVAQLLVAQAYRHADMTAVEPMSFVRLIWAALIGYVAFAEIPDGWTWSGAAVIFLAATVLARAEKSGTG